MTYSVFIDGAAGTTGLEIADRLSERAEFDLVMLTEEKRKDITARREAINDSDFVILCLPDEAAKEAVALIENQNTRVIDASSAHRTASDWVFGFAEFKDSQRDKNRYSTFCVQSGLLSNRFSRFDCATYRRWFVAE